MAPTGGQKTTKRGPGGARRCIGDLLKTTIFLSVFEVLGAWGLLVGTYGLIWIPYGILWRSFGLVWYSYGSLWIIAGWLAPPCWPLGRSRILSTCQVDGKNIWFGVYYTPLRRTTGLQLSDFILDRGYKDA